MRFPSIENKEIVLVVPCFNESNRWDAKYWEEVSKIPGLLLIFVNDGSTDDTEQLIRGFSNHLVNLSKNVGKAEAIRHGFTSLFDEDYVGIGFLDADAAFSPADIERLIDSFRAKNSISQSPTAIWSSRVQLAGRRIERRMSRHYLARFIVTLLAIRLKFSIYDPQSGLKIYPCGKDLVSCFDDPFETRWFVDLEIYERYKKLNAVPMNVWEEPVDSWKDIDGSKINRFEYIKIIKDIAFLMR